MMHTQIFNLEKREHRNYVDLVRGCWPLLFWRHAGFGALQAYIREGQERELRVHIWHDSLVKPGIDESGLCHDHRFNMRSHVLCGTVFQTDFEIEESDDGEFETYTVLHARAALQKSGSLHEDPVKTGKRYHRYPAKYGIPAGNGYLFEKFAFHETRFEGLTITLVEKTAQEAVDARILAPYGKHVVHAFTETLAPTEYEFVSVVNKAFKALEEINYDRKTPWRSS